MQAMMGGARVSQLRETLDDVLHEALAHHQTRIDNVRATVDCFARECSYGPNE